MNLVYFSDTGMVQCYKAEQVKFISLLQLSLNPWLGQVPLEGTKDNTSVLFLFFFFTKLKSS